MVVADTTTVADNNGMQDRAVDYNGEGQEWAARDSGDSGVAMMAAVAEVCGGGRRWRGRTTTAAAEDDSGGSQQQRQRTTTGADNNGTQDRAADYTGKEEPRQQTSTAFGVRLMPTGRECEKIKKSSLRKKTFFSKTVCLVGFFIHAKTPNTTF
jgi:hypothetical protein